MLVHPTKPQIPLFDSPVAPYPGKNYAYQLLAYHVEILAPRRTLDAGCGELRTFSIYPGEYVGITHNRPVFYQGVVKNQGLIAVRGFPEVYLMRLESDFSFIAPVDLAVCTFTIGYVDGRIDVLRRLAQRVRHGGSLIFTDDTEFQSEMLNVLEAEFEQIEVTYFGLENRFVSDPRELIDLTAAEMAAPNTPDFHSQFYVRAVGKKVEATPAGPRPAIRNDHGLLLVEADISRVKLD